MATTGTASLDFGAFPGASDASVNVTGQAAITGASFVEAWIAPAATADHSADEHVIENIRVMAGNISAGVGFTIYGVHTGQINEPVGDVAPRKPSAGPTGFASVAQRGSQGGIGPRLYGVWNVAWVWT